MSALPPPAPDLRAAIAEMESKVIREVSTVREDVRNQIDGVLREVRALIGEVNTKADAALVTAQRAESKADAAGAAVVTTQADVKRNREDIRSLQDSDSATAARSEGRKDVIRAAQALVAGGGAGAAFKLLEALLA